MIKCYYSPMLNVIKRIPRIALNIRSFTFWFFWIIFLITIIGEIHFIYPDEFENILGGRYILEGRLPYIGFFTHHNPFAYFFAVPISAIAGQSFIKFRLLLGLVYTLMSIGFFLWIKQRFGFGIAGIIMVWLVFIAIGATYWWGHMLLADSLSSYFAAASIISLFWLFWRREKLRNWDLLIVSLLTALMVLTTMTLVYLAAAIYLLIIAYFLKNKPGKSWFKQILKIIGIFSIPYLVFAVYLLITGSLQEFIYQSIVFNAQYYAFLPGGVSVKNPLRVVIVLFYQFFTNFKTMLVMTKDLNFGSPFAQTLVLSNAVLLIYSIIEKRFFIAIFIWVTLMFSIVRSNPYTTAETDYQGMAYHLISIFNGLVVLSFIWKTLKTKIFDAKYLLSAGGFLFLSAYFLFFGLHLTEKYLEKAYLKYMGQQSLIYDRPSVAPLLNQLLSKDDYYFLGPFDFENHLYTNIRPASKYIVTISAMDSSEKIQNEVLTDLQKNKPAIIIYDTEMRVFGSKPGGFLKIYMKDNYFNLEHLGAPCINFKAATKWFGSYDFERHFFFRNEDQETMLKKLWEQKLILPVDSKLPAFCQERLKDPLQIK